jgi:hypothetical protein
MKTPHIEGGDTGNYWSVPVGLISGAPISATEIPVDGTLRRVVNLHPFLGSFRPSAQKLAEAAITPIRAELIKVIRRGDGHGGRLDGVDEYRMRLLDFGVGPHDDQEDRRYKYARRQELMRTSREKFAAQIGRLNALAADEDKLFIAADMAGDDIPRSRMALGRLAGFEFDNEHDFAPLPLMGLQDGSTEPLPRSYPRAWPFVVVE